MKNYNFSPNHFGVPWPLKYLFLGLLFTFGSCQKDFISDVMVSETNAAGSTQQMSTSRSSDLENEVVQYTQWIIDNVVPIVKDPLVYRRHQSRQLFYHAQWWRKLNALGFTGYSDFAAQLKTASNTTIQSVKSGEFKSDELLKYLLQNISILDFSPIVSNAQGLNSDPDLPCYTQMIHAFLFLIVEVAEIMADDPAAAARKATMGVIQARINFMDCIAENYPGG